MLGWLSWWKAYYQVLSHRCNFKVVVRRNMSRIWMYVAVSKPTYTGFSASWQLCFSNQSTLVSWVLLFLRNVCRVQVPCQWGECPLCICVHGCRYVGMHVCIYVGVHVCRYVGMHVCRCTCVQVYMCAGMHVCVQVCMCAGMHVCRCECIQVCVLCTHACLCVKVRGRPLGVDSLPLRCGTRGLNWGV